MSHKPSGGHKHTKPAHHGKPTKHHHTGSHPSHKPKTPHHTHPGHKAHKGHTSHKPKKTGAGLIEMCAFEAAGLLTGADALEAYRDYGSPESGASIPEAMSFLGLTPVRAPVLHHGTILRLSRPGWSHAVLVEDSTDDGVWVWSWGELYWLTSDYVSTYGKDAWDISGLATGCST